MSRLKARCIKKNRDSKNRISTYTLIDSKDVIKEFTGKELKEFIRSGELEVENLQIDKAGRLVDKINTKVPASYPVYQVKPEHCTGADSIMGCKLYLGGEAFATIVSPTEILVNGKKVNISKYIAQNNLDINNIRIWTAKFLEGYKQC